MESEAPPIYECALAELLAEGITPTPAALQRRRDSAWTPAVGDPCLGRFRAGPDGLALRKAWFPGARAPKR